MEFVSEEFLHDLRPSLLGCLSFEERCLHVPLWTWRKLACPGIRLLRIEVSDSTVPDYRDQAREKIEHNNETIALETPNARVQELDLLATDEEIRDAFLAFLQDNVHETVILDISSFPKRFFCLFLRIALSLQEVRNVILSYTQAGYPPEQEGPLAEDILQGDCLPGFLTPITKRGDTIVISLGFEEFSISSILDMCRDVRSAKFLSSFPPDGEYSRRQWRVLRNITRHSTVKESRSPLEHMRVVCALDSERVFETLEHWGSESDGLVLLPFGPKPHTLAMALYAIKHDRAMYYSQPKAYRPDYALGTGPSWAYIVKWDGVPCYERTVEVP